MAFSQGSLLEVSSVDELPSATLRRKFMKSLIIAVGLLAVGATTASAQYGGWNRDSHPYERRHHSVCQDKAERLHRYERRSARDGRIDRREQATIEALRRDLGRTCGGFRWRG
jgi:hypothetical protein